MASTCSTARATRPARCLFRLFAVLWRRGGARRTVDPAVHAKPVHVVDLRAEKHVAYPGRRDRICVRSRRRARCGCAPGCCGSGVIAGGIVLEPCRGGSMVASPASAPAICSAMLPRPRLPLGTLAAAVGDRRDVVGAADSTTRCRPFVPARFTTPAMSVARPILPFVEQRHYRDGLRIYQMPACDAIDYLVCFTWPTSPNRCHGGLSRACCWPICPNRCSVCVCRVGAVRHAEGAAIPC